MHSPVDRVGQILGGRYKLLRLVGQGGMGVVYEAIRLDLQQRVAVKLLLRAPHDQESRGRFAREARIMAGLTNVHVVRLLDYVDDPSGSLPFIVMEYLEGRSLASVVEGGGPMHPGRAAKLGVQLLDGVAALHRVGIVHRDLKPQNLMLIGTGSLGELAKILDFGVAKISEADRVPATKDGKLLGTLPFMAPEQARGEPVDHRVDIFGAGTCLHFALTGFGPYGNRSGLDAWRAAMDGDRPPLAQIAPQLPGELAAIVDRALAPVAANRFATADELVLTLLAWLAAQEHAPATTFAPASAGGRALLGPDSHSRPPATMASANAPSVTAAMVRASHAPVPRAASDVTTAPLGNGPHRSEGSVSPPYGPPPALAAPTSPGPDGYAAGGAPGAWSPPPRPGPPSGPGQVAAGQLVPVAPSFPDASGSNFDRSSAAPVANNMLVVMNAPTPASAPAPSGGQSRMGVIALAFGFVMLLVGAAALGGAWLLVREKAEQASSTDSGAGDVAAPLALATTSEESADAGLPKAPPSGQRPPNQGPGGASKPSSGPTPASPPGGSATPLVPTPQAPVPNGNVIPGISRCPSAECDGRNGSCDSQNRCVCKSPAAGVPVDICNGSCRTLMGTRTSVYCGGCNVKCLASEQCFRRSDGLFRCQKCESPKQFLANETTGGSCIDVRNNPSHCGRLNNKCPPGANCVVDKCVLP